MKRYWWDDSPPWVHRVTKSKAIEIAEESPSSVVIFRLQGSGMRDAHDLFLEFKRKMSFPGYFGHNWPALEDCLFDMTWLPSPGGYLLLIDDWSLVLSESKDEIPVLLRILGDAGSSWSQYPGASVPFNTLLIREDEEGGV